MADMEVDEMPKNAGAAAGENDAMEEDSSKGKKSKDSGKKRFEVKKASTDGLVREIRWACWDREQVERVSRILGRWWDA
jgi:hypothetical protein